MRYLRIILVPSIIALLLTNGIRGAAPTPADPAPAAQRPEPGQPFANTLGMKFVPVKGVDGLFGVWDVRVQDYQAFMTAVKRGWDKPPFAQGPTHPAVNVSWDDAQAFCRWLTQKEREEGRLGPRQGYRLPTDAEWSQAAGLEEPARGTPQSKDSKIKEPTNPSEIAASAGKLIYPWGSSWPPPKDSGNYDNFLKADTFEFTSPVGSFAANRQGLFDLSGNVWQWCEDQFDGSSGKRTLRGAAYFNVNADNLLLSRRTAYDPATRIHYVGFRVVLDASGTTSAR